MGEVVRNLVLDVVCPITRTMKALLLLIRIKPNRYDVQNKNKKWTLGCFKCDTLSKKKDCHATTIPYMAYITHIQKNFFPRTSLEGQTTWSKMVKIDENCRGGGGSGITVPQIYFKAAAHYSFPHAHIKSLFPPSLSQRWSTHNNLTPGVIFIIFNYVLVPKSLRG